MADQAGGSIIWNLQLEVDKFNSDLAGVKKQVNGLATDLKKANTSTQESTSQFSKLASTVKTLATGYLALKVVQEVNGFMRDSIANFEEAEGVYNKLTNTILNQKGARQQDVDALVSQSEALEKVSTLDATTIQAGQAQIATFNGMTAAMVEKLTPAWLDYTVKEHGMVITTEMAKQSANDMTKAVEGQVEALTRQGFKLTDADRAILAHGTMAERVTVVINAMAYAHGAAAAAAETFEGKQIRLSNELDEGKKAIGGVADLVKGTFIDALIGGGNGMESFGNNALSIAKDVGTAFLKMGEVVSQVMNELFTDAAAAGDWIGQRQANVQAANSKRDLQKNLDKQEQDFKKQTADILNNKDNLSGRAMNKELEQLNEQNEIQKKLIQSKPASDALGVQSANQAFLDEKKAGDQKRRDIAATYAASISKLNALQKISGLFTPGQGSGNVDTSAPEASDAKQQADDAKQLAKLKQDETDKVVALRVQEAEWQKQRAELITKEKEDLADLKDEYDKATEAIKKNLADLDTAFANSEKSAESSFLSSLASAADTAQQTIKDRQLQIQSLQNGINTPQLALAQAELVKLQNSALKASGADLDVLKAKIDLKQQEVDKQKQLALANSGTTGDQITNLQALNARDQAILDANSAQIAQAQQVEADKKTALGVQQVVDQYTQERNERLAQYQQDKADLQQQLADKATEYAKSQLKIKTDTTNSIADIQKAYFKMFDDLQTELARLGESFLNLLKLGAISAPGPSQQAQDAYAALIKNSPKRAMGGPVSAGVSYLVGERGPELFTPSQSGGITPNGAMGNNTVNVYVAEKADWAYGIELIKRELGLAGVRAAAGISS